MTTDNKTKRSRWSASFAVLVPVVVSLLATSAATLAFVLWSAHGVDERAMERQTRLARHVIDSQLARVPHEQESVAVWDDAITHLRAGDNAWIDNNLGTWMYEFFGHDVVLVLDSQDRVVYAMRRGKQVSVDDAGPQLDGIGTLVATMRRQVAEGVVDSYENGTTALVPHVTDLAIVAGVPAVVSITPIISDTADLIQPRGSEFLDISIEYLNNSSATRLSDEYSIRGARFTQLATSAPGVAQLPLTNGAGRFITFFEWAPDLPGQAIINQTLPAIAGALLVAALIAMILIDQLWRKSHALERGRADAERLASHDALTGLPNRSAFEAVLGRALARKPSRDRQATLLLLDLDRFKQVNDTLGHHAGDDLLEAVAQRLAELVGPDDALARLGGDEFAILHLHPPGHANAINLSDRIIDAIAKPFDISGGEAFVGVSIGIATAEDGEADARELTRRADIALYEAKTGGRNRAVVFAEPMNELLQNRRTIEAELREALRSGDQLSVAFQPLYRRERRRICGAEALARWHHPRLGQVSPVHFIPVAEASGLIESLGEYVLREACRVGARFPGRLFAVNISPTQLRNRNFSRLVFDILAETGMRPADLELEITEGILLEEESVAAEALHLCRAAGVHIALDDFGTGYSSLNYLKRYPVDRIKIDRSFVSQLQTGGPAVAIVQAMVTLAHALGITVTAEGVETHEQVRILSEMRCDIFQGFLLSPPVATEALADMLNEDASANASDAKVA